MSMINQNLYGCWKMTEMRFLRPDGTWDLEPVIGGSSVFTQNGHISTFTRTADLPYGYSGRFTIKGNDLLVYPEASSIPEQEGHLLIRTVKELSADHLVLAMNDEATGRKYEMKFSILERHFAR